MRTSEMPEVSAPSTILWGETGDSERFLLHRLIPFFFLAVKGSDNKSPATCYLPCKLLLWFWGLFGVLSRPPPRLLLTDFWALDRRQSQKRHKIVLAGTANSSYTVVSDLPLWSEVTITCIFLFDCFFFPLVIFFFLNVCNAVTRLCIDWCLWCHLF